MSGQSQSFLEFSTYRLQRHYEDVLVIVPDSEVVLRCSIAGRFSSDQPSVVVKLELMRSVAENSRKQNVVLCHSNSKVDPSAFSQRSLLSMRCPQLLPSISQWLIYRLAFRGVVAITLVECRCISISTAGPSGGAVSTRGGQ